MARIASSPGEHCVKDFVPGVGRVLNDIAAATGSTPSASDIADFDDRPPRLVEVVTEIYCFWRHFRDFSWDSRVAPMTLIVRLIKTILKIYRLMGNLRLDDKFWAKFLQPCPNIRHDQIL